jgi:hypothetical protein
MPSCHNSTCPNHKLVERLEGWRFFLGVDPVAIATAELGFVVGRIGLFNKSFGF